MNDSRERKSEVPGITQRIPPAVSIASFPPAIVPHPDSAVKTTANTAEAADIAVKAAHLAVKAAHIAVKAADIAVEAADIAVEPTPSGGRRFVVAIPVSITSGLISSDTEVQKITWQLESFRAAALRRRPPRCGRGSAGP